MRDGTLNYQGGTIESRGTRPPQIDPHDDARAEIERHKEAVGTILDNINDTLLNPLRTNFPRLEIIERSYDFRDDTGYVWEITPLRMTEDGNSLESTFIKGLIKKIKPDGSPIDINVAIRLDRSSFQPFIDAFSTIRSGTTDGDIKFVDDKVTELLAPTKAAQETVNGALSK